MKSITKSRMIATVIDKEEPLSEEAHHHGATESVAASKELRSDFLLRMATTRRHPTAVCMLAVYIQHAQHTLVEVAFLFIVLVGLLATT